MFTICFYQDSRHEKPLYWIRKILKIGYISRRNDGITELRINGFKQVRDIVKNLLPFIQFKKKQAQAIYEAADILNRKRSDKLNKNELLKLINYILIIQQNNYITKRKKTKSELMENFRFDPVSTGFSRQGGR